MEAGAGLISPNFKYLAEIKGSLSTEGLQSSALMSLCRQQWSVEVNASLGLHFSFDSDYYYDLITGRCMISPKCILPQDNDLKHISKIIENHLQSKQEQEVLKVLTWSPQPWSQHQWVCLRLEREGFKEAKIYRRSGVRFARCLKQAEFLWKLCASVEWMRFWRKRVITRNIDLMWFDLLFIQCILFIYENKLLTDSFLILVYNIFSYTCP